MLTISMLLTGEKIFMVNELKSMSEVDIKYTTALLYKVSVKCYDNDVPEIWVFLVCTSFAN